MDNDTGSGRVLMAPYGTLRIGHGNWRWAFAEAKVVQKDDTVAGYTLKATSPKGGIPAAFENKLDSGVVVDVLDITDMPDMERTLERVDCMEFACGYVRRLIHTKHGHDAWMYVMPEESTRHFVYPVPRNDWNLMGAQ